MQAHALEQMLAELEANKLEVVLAPSRRPDRRDHDLIRVVASRPPQWYRKLCADHPSSRGVRRGKPDTKIRRANVLRQLAGLIAGTYHGKYQQVLLSIARDHRAPVSIKEAVAAAKRKQPAPSPWSRLPDGT